MRMPDQPGSDDAAAMARRHLDLCSAVVAVRLLGLFDEALRQGVLLEHEAQRCVRALAAAVEDLTAGPVTTSGAEDLRRRADELVADASAAPPLARLASFAGLPGSHAGPVAVDVVATAAIVERDVRVGAAVATLQGSMESRWPCVGLIAQLSRRDFDEMARLVAWLHASGLVTIDNPAEPRYDQTVRLPRAVQEALDGEVPAGLDLSLPSRAPAFPDLVLPDQIVGRIARAHDLLADRELDALVVRGAPGSGRRTVLRAIAGRLGRGLLVTEPGEGGQVVQAVALLTGALLAWVVEPRLGQLIQLPKPLHGMPVGVVTGRSGAVQVADAQRVAVVDLPVPAPEARCRFWSRAGLRAEKAVLDTISRRFVLCGGSIVRVAALAGAIARLEDRDEATVDDVRLASQELGRQQLESLATLLPPLPAGFAPVLGGAAAEAFETLVLRARHREGLPVAIGGAAGEQITRGVRALLSGPSGTGKTLSARALGARLGLDVYRADLAALVDKYIGETERRLDDLFSRSEQLDVVLLIDEGDALMTRRTDVRSSNDRYANLETDYLLQRLESYEGIVLITTNAPQLVDSAFHRRLDVTVSFSPPGPPERLEIWHQHLPQRHAVTAMTLDRLATACRLTGGQIRQAAVHAALLALDADGVVDDDCLIAAVERELTVAGKTSPLDNGAAIVSSYERARRR